MKRYEFPGAYLRAAYVSNTDIVINGNVPIISYTLNTSIDPDTQDDVCEYYFEDPKYPNNTNLSGSYIYLASEGQVDETAPIILYVDYIYFIETTYYRIGNSRKYFNYKYYDGRTPSVDDSLYVQIGISCSNNIVINKYTCKPENNFNHIDSFSIKNGETKTKYIEIGVNNVYYGGSFNILFRDINDKPIIFTVYNGGLVINDKQYVTSSNNDLRCIVSKYDTVLVECGYIYTTGFLDYTFESTDWDSNTIYTNNSLKLQGSYLLNMKCNYFAYLTYEKNNKTYNIKLYVTMNYD